MRVLFASWAWPSHYFPLVPLGWGLLAEGHEVRVASQPALMPAVTASGLAGVPVGTDLDFAALMRKPMEGVGAARMSREFWRELAARKTAEAMATFVTLAENMLDDLLAQCRAWRPDLIVHDTTTYAAPIAAALLGIPAVRHTWGPDLMARFDTSGLGDLLARHGLSPDDLAARTTVDPCPPSMQIDSPLHRTWLRYTPYNGPARAPRWTWERRGDRPLVCITMGTTSGKLGGEDRPLPLKIVDALSDVDVVLAVSEAERAALGTLPPNVRTEVMIPLHVVLPHCDLLVQRGGGCTTMTGLTYGVPQLVVPYLPDHAFNGRQFAATGAGLMLPDGETTPSSLRESLDRLLNEKTFAAKAAEVQAEMAAQPSTAEVVGKLESLVC